MMPVSSLIDHLIQLQCSCVQSTTAMQVVYNIIIHKLFLWRGYKKLFEYFSLIKLFHIVRIFKQPLYQHN